MKLSKIESPYLKLRVTKFWFISIIDDVTTAILIKTKGSTVMTSFDSNFSKFEYIFWVKLSKIIFYVNHVIKKAISAITSVVGECYGPALVIKLLLVYGVRDKFWEEFAY